MGSNLLAYSPPFLSKFLHAIHLHQISRKMWSNLQRDSTHPNQEVSTHFLAKFCPWSRELFQYKELYGHNSLLEPVHGDLDYTEEQLETMAALVKQKKRDYAANLRKSQ